MRRLTRRDAFKTALVGAAATQMPASAAPQAATRGPRFGGGIEGQRKADLGDGTYRNPIVPGDHPDPTILKDGADYYMTFSSFQSYPGAVIWHSTDLVNWAPIAAALQKPIGTVWAMDLVKHAGRSTDRGCHPHGSRRSPCLHLAAPGCRGNSDPRVSPGPSPTRCRSAFAVPR